MPFYRSGIYRVFSFQWHFVAVTFCRDTLLHIVIENVETLLMCETPPSRHALKMTNAHLLVTSNVFHVRKGLKLFNLYLDQNNTIKRY